MMIALRLIGLALFIIDLWPGALPDWLVDDVPNDDSPADAPAPLRRYESDRLGAIA